MNSSINISAHSSKTGLSINQVKNLQCKNLLDYLKTLPHAILDQLYNHPTTCLAVFRLENRLRFVLYNYLLIFFCFFLKGASRNR